jgi:hypothetical protein
MTLSTFQRRCLAEIARRPASSEMGLCIRLNRQRRRRRCGMADCWVACGELERLGLIYMTTRANWAATPKGRKVLK